MSDDPMKNLSRPTFLLIAMASLPLLEGPARASETNPGVFSCNLEFRGREEADIRRVHACRRGVVWAHEVGSPTQAELRCREHYGAGMVTGNLVACFVGIRNYFRQASNSLYRER